MRAWTGNHLADEAAKQASVPKERWIEGLAETLDARQQKLDQIVRMVQIMQVEILTKAAEANMIHRRVDRVMAKGLKL
eukprot:13899743-Alexandrium_andersonii.AAC.1